MTIFEWIHLFPKEVSKDQYREIRYEKLTYLSDIIRDMKAEELMREVEFTEAITESYFEAKLGDEKKRRPKPVEANDKRCPFPSWGSDGSRVYTYKQALCDASLYREDVDM